MSNAAIVCARCGAPWPGYVCGRCGLRENREDLRRWSGGPARLPTPVATISPYQRFYLTRDSGATLDPVPPNGPVNVPYDAWDDVNQCGSRLSPSVSGFLMSPTKQVVTSGPECLTTDFPNDPANETILLVQYISAPIEAGLISGTAKGQMRFSQDDPANDLHDRVTISLKVVSMDGQTVRGHLLPIGVYGTTNAYAAAATPTNRFLANGDSLTPVSAQAGDRLVLEIGSQASTQPQSSGAFVCLYCGDDQASDLPENETETANRTPWFEITP